MGWGGVGWDVLLLLTSCRIQAILFGRNDFGFPQSDDAAPLLAYPASPVYLGGCCRCWGCYCLRFNLACIMGESLVCTLMKRNEIWMPHFVFAAEKGGMCDSRCVVFPPQRVKMQVKGLGSKSLKKIPCQVIQCVLQGHRQQFSTYGKSINRKNPTTTAARRNYCGEKRW